MAENEFSAHSFPQHAYFEHHRSIQDLECSAKSGCELCKVILESCQRTPEQPGADVHGFSSPSNESMYSAALHTFPSDIKVCLNTSHVYGGDEIGKVKMWDTILIQIGKIPPPATLEGDEYEDTLDPVGLIIKAAPSEYIKLAYSSTLNHCTEHFRSEHLLYQRPQTRPVRNRRRSYFIHQL